MLDDRLSQLQASEYARTPALCSRREAKMIQRGAALSSQIADLLVDAATLAMMVACQMATFRVFEGYGTGPTRNSPLLLLFLGQVFA